MTDTTAGRCGDRLTTITGVDIPPTFCSRPPHDSNVWHMADNGAEWHNGHGRADVFNTRESVVAFAEELAKQHQAAVIAGGSTYLAALAEMGVDSATLELAKHAQSLSVQATEAWRSAAQVLRTAAHGPNARRPRIVVDPAVRWGRAILDGTHAATVDVAGMIVGGETVATVCDEYGLTRHQVLLACWHEAVNGDHQQQWGMWGMGVGHTLAYGSPTEVDALPDPPARVETPR